MLCMRRVCQFLFSGRENMREVAGCAALAAGVARDAFDLMMRLEGAHERAWIQCAARVLGNTRMKSLQKIAAFSALKSTKGTLNVRQRGHARERGGRVPQVNYSVP